MKQLVDLLIDLDSAGIELAAVDGQLRFRPTEKMTPELLGRLREHKPALLAHLDGGLPVVDVPILDVDGWPFGSFEPVPCTACGGLERWQDATGAWHCQHCDRDGLDRSLMLVGCQ